MLRSVFIFLVTAKLLGRLQQILRPDVETTGYGDLDTMYIFTYCMISLSTSSSDGGTFSPSGLSSSFLNFDSFFLVDSLGAWEHLRSPDRFLSPLSSLLFPFSFLLSSVPYSLHFPTLLATSLRENRGFRPLDFPPSIIWMNNAQCDLQSLPCKSPYNCVYHRGKQQHGCSHFTANCNLRAPNLLTQRSQSSY